MPERLSALAEAYRPGLYGTTDPAAATLVLQERRGLDLALLAGFPEDREALAAAVTSRLGLALPAPGRAAEAKGGTLLWQGPDRWLAVASEGRGLAVALREALAGRPAVAVTDLAHARSVIRLRGSAARPLLAKGCGLDLDPAVFEAGHCAVTRFGHQAVTLHARGAEAIDLYVTRSFALALWEELLDLGGEFGLRVEEAANG